MQYVCNTQATYYILWKNMKYFIQQCTYIYIY